MRKTIAKGTLSLVTFITTLSVFVVGVGASSFSLYDDFNSLTAVNPNEGGNWWVLNTGLDEFGQYTVVNDFCGDGTCVVAKNEDGVSYVSLEQYPTQVAGNYYNAELAEEHTGYAYQQPTQWNPEVGSPVVLETRVRWSANYKPNGTGGAIGSNGVWLWNSPIDYTNFVAHPQDGIGFNWLDAGASFSKGLNVGIIDDSAPVFQMPIKKLDMQQWNTFRFEWGVSAQGQQYVDIYVNGMFRGHHPLLSPLHDLSVEVWNDNQKPVDALGTIEFDVPSSTQGFELDYVNVTK